MELHIDITGDDKVVSQVLEKMMGVTDTQEPTTGGHATHEVTHATHESTHETHESTHETQTVMQEEPKPKRHPGRPKKNAADDEDEALRDKIFG